ncbi:MAG: c-type cytochrome [Chromatiales bacterium]|nr:c-type cytochrome [Chromatiales bacterium]
MISLSTSAKWLLAIGVLLSTSLAYAEEKNGTNAPLLYHNYCSVCHGDRGNGQSKANMALNPPPRDFGSASSRRELTRERIIHAIANGRPNTAMVGWSSQLSGKETAALADYLLENFIHPQDVVAKHPGKSIYEQNCAVCHGDYGSGGRWTTGMNIQPRDFTSERGRSLSRETMLDAVRNGRPGTAMAPFRDQLSAEQMGDVVDYIRVAFMSLPEEIEGLSGTYAHGKVAPADSSTSKEAEKPVNMNAPMPRGLKGNLVAGRDFYMGNCFTCHGVKGDGQGPRAYFIRPKPANFFDEKYQQGFNREAIFNAIRDGKLGTEMPAWGKVLNEQQLADITEFVFRAYIQRDQGVISGEEKKKE